MPAGDANFGEMDNIRIVIIEDNPADVVLVQKALAENGISPTMTHFQDGLDALEKLCPETGSPEIIPDLIILDLRLARSEGLEILEKLRQDRQFAQTPIAIISSSESQEDIQRAAKFGADRYILKPAQWKEFLTQVGGGIKELLLQSNRR